MCVAWMYLLDFIYGGGSVFFCDGTLARLRVRTTLCAFQLSYY